MNKAIEEMDERIFDMNNTINSIIQNNTNDRDYMSKNLLSNLRYLVEYILYKVYIIQRLG